MAARLNLTGGKLKHIWNVSSRVGPGSDDTNKSTDVELVSALVALALTHPRIARFGINGTMIAPSHSDKFDPILGFWIFRFQQINRHPASDGVVSPARGTVFAPGQPWVIYTLNEFASEANNGVWSVLDRNINLSPALKADLSR